MRQGQPKRIGQENRKKSRSGNVTNEKELQFELHIL